MMLGVSDLTQGESASTCWASSWLQVATSLVAQAGGGGAGVSSAIKTATGRTAAGKNDRSNHLRDIEHKSPYHLNVAPVLPVTAELDGRRLTLGDDGDFDVAGEAHHLPDKVLPAKILPENIAERE